MTGFDELGPHDKALATAVQAGLRRQEADLDLTTAARLRAARAKALEATNRPLRRTGWLYASGGFATAAAIALVVFLQAPLPGTISAPEGKLRPTKAEAFEVLTDEVDTEFYEDLDLYRWLDRGRDGAA